MSKCIDLKNDQLKMIMNSFYGKESVRNKALLAFGCSTGLRITEILSVRIGDILTKDGKIKEIVKITSQSYNYARAESDIASLSKDNSRKTKNHARDVTVNPFCHQYIYPLITLLNNRGYQHNEDHLFITSSGKIMKRWHAYRIIRTAAERCCISGTIGTHTMRKTFSKKMQDALDADAGVKKTEWILALKELLGHKDINSTIHYIGIDKDMMKKKVLKANLYA